MENKNIPTSLKTIPIQTLQSGMIIHSFLDVPAVFKNLMPNTIQFLLKNDFKNIVIERKGETLEVDSEELRAGDQILRMGVLNKPMELHSKVAIDSLKKVGFKQVKVFMAAMKEDKNSLNHVSKGLTSPRPEREKAKKRLGQLQESMQENRKLIQKGYSIINDIFENSRRHVFQVEPAKELARDLILSIKTNKFATNVLSVLKSHDEYTFQHCLDVANQMLMVYSDMANNQQKISLETVALGGLLHDIGKSQIPIEILTKKGPLFDSEWVEMKKHPAYGAQQLTKLGLDKDIISMAYYHHVKKNGKGYPQKPYDKIGELAKITALADIYQALVTKRPYKPSLPPHIALEKISELSETDYDEDLAYRFIQTLGVYPVGSLVSLTNNHAAFVVGWAHVSIRPQVMMVLDEKGSRLQHSDYLDLSAPEYNELSITKALDHRNFFGEDAAEIFMSLAI